MNNWDRAFTTLAVNVTKVPEYEGFSDGVTVTEGVNVGITG